MNWYKEYKREWKEIIETISREVNRTPQMIEKDTLQSMFLKELSRTELPFVFKGGTSLSKGYGLIDRFSEDIDLSMNVKPTESDKRKAKAEIERVADGLGMILENPEDIQSRYNYNKYVYEYDSLFSDISLELIVETSFYQTAYPAVNHVVRSIIGDFCERNDLALPVPFDSATVFMNLQSLERTLVDKVFAICDYRIQDMQDRDSRHLYDIAKILPHVKLNKELDELIDNVRDDRMYSKNNPSAQLKYDIPVMLSEIIESRFYESDYNNVTKKLLYEDVSYNDAIKSGIAVLADMDIFKYKK